jgi:hypothetical protein
VLAELLKKYLTAVHAMALGDDTKIRSFRNNSEGLPYAYKSDVPDGDDLKLRAEGYAELTVPAGGLLLTAGVDVQHDRLAVVIRAWGRGEESWLVFWGEIFGSTLVPDAGAWLDLDAAHARLPARLRRRAAGVGRVDRRLGRQPHRNRSPTCGAAGAPLHGDQGRLGADRRQARDLRHAAQGRSGQAGKMAKKGLETYIVGTARART